MAAKDPWLQAASPWNRLILWSTQRLLRTRAFLCRRQSLVGMLLLWYLSVVVYFWVWGGHGLAILTFSPLVLGPLLGALIYWVVWSDFHR